MGIIRVSRYHGSNEKHRAYLAGLYVEPEFRGRGCGRALVEQALAWVKATGTIRRVNLTVVTERAPAIRLYQAFGFRIYGTEKEAFSSDDMLYDEHLMTLELASSRNL